MVSTRTRVLVLTSVFDVIKALAMVNESPDS